MHGHDVVEAAASFSHVTNWLGSREELGGSHAGGDPLAGYDSGGRQEQQVVILCRSTSRIQYRVEQLRLG